MSSEKRPAHVKKGHIGVDKRGCGRPRAVSWSTWDDKDYRSADQIPSGPTVGLIGRSIRWTAAFPWLDASAESDPPSPVTSSKMHAQRLAQKHVLAAYRIASRARQLRRLTTTPPPSETPQPTPSSKPYRYEKAEPERSWVVQRIRANPVAFKIVRALSRALGYGSTKQVAGRRTLAMYEQVCAIKPSEDRVFWQEGERLHWCAVYFLVV